MSKATWAAAGAVIVAAADFGLFSACTLFRLFAAKGQGARSGQVPHLLANVAIGEGLSRETRREKLRVELCQGSAWVL